MPTNKARIYTGQTYITAPRPVRDKRDGRWTIRNGPIGAATAADALAFADSLVTSLAVHIAREGERSAVVAGPREPWTDSDGRIIHPIVPHAAAEGTTAVSGLHSRTERAAVGRLVARFAAMRAARPGAPEPARKPTTPAPTIARAADRRIARGVKVEPVAGAPVMAPAAIASDARRRCERCGRVDFYTDAGLTWHRAYNRDCATVSAAVRSRHQYADGAA